MSYLQRFRLRRDKVVNISVGGRPSSIRDQILEAKRTIDNAATAEKEEDRLIGPGRRLLVVGAGVTGVAASWFATRWKGSTALQDTKITPLSRQAECRSRWLHPYAYDWPKGHWWIDEFPKLGELIPEILEWKSDQSANVANNWIIKFFNWSTELQKKDPNIFKWLPDKEITLPPESSQVEWERWRDEVDSGSHYDMILVCAGAVERCALTPDDTFRSFRFWETDPYEDTYFELAPRSKFNILVSGGGDGGLQEFLRILCRKPAKKDFVHVCFLMDRLEGVLRPMRAYERFWRTVDGPLGERPPQMTLVDACKNFLQDVCLEPDRARLEEVLDTLINPRFFAEGGDTIHLNLGNDAHFGPALSLNAFLVTLFAWRVEKRSKKDVYFPNAKLLSIASAQEGHICERDPTHLGCLGKCHRVEYRKKDGSTGAGLYDIVVIRHGIDPIVPAESKV